MSAPTQQRTPRVAAEQVEQLTDLLGRNGDWASAAELGLWLGMDDRRVRAVAHAAGGRVISGDAGYKLTALAEPGEVRHAVARLRSQAVKMGDRAAAIEAEAGQLN